MGEPRGADVPDGAPSRVFARQIGDVTRADGSSSTAESDSDYAGSVVGITPGWTSSVFNPISVIAPR